MKHTNIKFIIYLLVAAVISATVFFIPTFSEAELSTTLASALFYTFALLGAAWYFFTSLKTFKVGLKVAYYLLTIGIILYSLVLAQFFLLIFIDLSVFWRNALFFIPYSLTSLLAYLGMRKFAKLLELKSLWTSPWFVFGLAIVAAIAVSQLPHAPEVTSADTGLDEMTLDLIMGVLVWATVFGISAGIVALQVRRAISQTYRSAMVWMAAALFTLSFSVVHELVVKVYFMSTNYAQSDFVVWPFLLASVLFLGAGMAFKAARRYALNLSENASYIDVVTATAQLVSQPGAVDSELNTLREITATNPNPKALSNEQKQSLTNLYLSLEDYLVTKEPLSKFNRKDLREALPKDFVAALH